MVPKLILDCTCIGVVEQGVIGPVHLVRGIETETDHVLWAGILVSQSHTILLTLYWNNNSLTKSHLT